MVKGCRAGAEIKHPVRYFCNRRALEHSLKIRKATNPADQLSGFHKASCTGVVECDFAGLS